MQFSESDRLHSSCPSTRGLTSTAFQTDLMPWSNFNIKHSVSMSYHTKLIYFKKKKVIYFLMPMTVFKNWDTNQDHKSTLEIFFTAKEAVCVLAAGQRAVIFFFPLWRASGEFAPVVTGLPSNCYFLKKWNHRCNALKPFGRVSKLKMNKEMNKESLILMEESRTAEIISLRTCMRRKNKLLPPKWMTQYITLINDSDGNNSIGDK